MVADKDINTKAIPMLNPFDLSLKQEKYDFTNSKGISIKYYYYYKEVTQKDTLILFLPGLGSHGHYAYIREIDELCEKGYKVLTLDYTGCGESLGKRLTSMVIPTRDTMELLDYLSTKDTIIPIGHSMGGFTAINLLYLREEITKGVVISPFINLRKQLSSFLNKEFILNKIMRYEKKTVPEYTSIDLESFLKETNKDILFIQDKNDPMCKYEYSLGEVINYNNPHIKAIVTEGKKHNPNYTSDAIDYMNETIGTYNYLVKKKQLKTYEDRLNYFKDKSVIKMTEQDKEIWKEIFAFIRK